MTYKIKNTRKSRIVTVTENGTDRNATISEYNHACELLSVENLCKLNQGKTVVLRSQKA